MHKITSNGSPDRGGRRSPAVRTYVGNQRCSPFRRRPRHAPTVTNPAAKRLDATQGDTIVGTTFPELRARQARTIRPPSISVIPTYRRPRAGRPPEEWHWPPTH